MKIVLLFVALCGVPLVYGQTSDSASGTCTQKLTEHECDGSTAAAAPVTTADGSTHLWDIYFSGLSKAKYIDLSHVLKPAAPIWYGFGHPQQFKPAVDPATGSVYR